MNSIIDAQRELQEQLDLEYKRCLDSPYYYCTNYLKINGKKFTTIETEENFNKFIIVK